MFKETENFFNDSKQNRLTIYFKIEVYKILKKSTLPASHFHENLLAI